MSMAHTSEKHVALRTRAIVSVVLVAIFLCACTKATLLPRDRYDNPGPATLFRIYTAEGDTVVASRYVTTDTTIVVTKLWDSKKGSPDLPEAPFEIPRENVLSIERVGVNSLTVVIVGPLLLAFFLWINSLDFNFD